MDENICQTCLSLNRRYIPLKKAHSLIQDFNFQEIKHLDGSICWECYKIMENFSNFKSQVKLAQDSIKLKIKLNKCLSKLSMQYKNSYDYQFYYHSDPLLSYESWKTELNIVKEEETESNCNNYDEEIEINKNIYDEKPDVDSCINVYVDSLEVKANVVNNYSSSLSNRNGNNAIAEVIEKAEDVTSLHEHRLPNTIIKSDKSKPKYNKNKKTCKVQDEKIRNKFAKIVFTVKEMIENREQRRNRPNFKKIQFKCDSCLIGFTRQEKFDEHIKNKHEESIGAFVCDVCKVRFAHKNAIERHCQTHFIFYRCKLCKFESVKLWQAYTHCETRHRADDINSIHCQQCSIIFKTPEELDKHMTTMHVIFCNECGEKFKKKSTLRTHKVRIHGVKREFVCTICNKSFMKASRLETHIANHNDTLAQQLSYCAICNIQYKSVQVYRSHLRQSAAHSPDQYPCPECNKKFSSKVYLTKHYNFYHLKKSQFKCELCNKLFISDWRLKNHRQKHHGLSRTRNHPCNVCGKKFFTQSTLRGHQLTHSEQRTFMCEDCGDTFKQRPALYTHTKLVHKGVKRKKL